MVMDCRSRWFGLEQEGFGIVFVEAAACGLAQIAGRSGGSDDAVFDGVPGSSLTLRGALTHLADAIEELMLDGERRGLYARQRSRARLSQFSWDALARGALRGLEPFDHFSIAAHAHKVELRRRSGTKSDGDDDSERSAGESSMRGDRL